MTARRIADGFPRGPSTSSFSSTYPAGSGRGYGTQEGSQNPRPFDRHSPTLHSKSSSSPMNTQSPQHNQRNSGNSTSAPIDKSLSVQELKALTRMRLAREAGSNQVHGTNHIPKPPTSGPPKSNFNPSMTYPQRDCDMSPDKRSVDDYYPLSHDRYIQPTYFGGMSTRSGNTSPTVDSSSTGSDSEMFVQTYHPKHQKSLSPHSALQPSRYHNSSSNHYRSSVEKIESIDPILLPPCGRNGREIERYHEPYSLPHRSDLRGHQFKGDQSQCDSGSMSRHHSGENRMLNRYHPPPGSVSYRDDSPDVIYPSLHEKLVDLERQQVTKEKLLLQRERDREHTLREEQRRRQQCPNPRQHPPHEMDEHMKDSLTLEIPPDAISVEQKGFSDDFSTGSNLDNISIKEISPPQSLYESSLRKLVLNKSMNNGILSDCTSSSSGPNPLDQSLLPSSSPFYPTTASNSSHSQSLPPELVPSPPDSPKSLRNLSRRPLSINCPAPVRMRSSSDSNDLAFSVAESVLLTPTAGSPATSFRKGIATSPSNTSTLSRRNSVDSVKSIANVNITGIGYGTEPTNPSNIVGSVCGVRSTGGSTQFSLDSNDELSNSGTLDSLTTFNDF